MAVAIKTPQHILAAREKEREAEAERRAAGAKADAEALESAKRELLNMGPQPGAFVFLDFRDAQGRKRGWSGRL